MNPEPLPRASLLKVPRQRRAIDTVHLILDAGIRVLEREGVAGFTTNRVAEVAGVSPGSLYQYFTNKEMIISGIVERGVLATEQQIRDAALSASGLEPHALARQLLLAILIQLEPYRALLAEILSATPILSSTGMAAILETRFSDVFRGFFAVHGERYALRGGAAGLYLALNGAIFVVLKWLSERPSFITREALVDSIVMQLGVLLEERPSA
jgi:AcrR family transcriptional regulator